jgi:hypothetical protein
LMSGRGGVFEAFLHPSPGKGREVVCKTIFGNVVVCSRHVPRLPLRFYRCLCHGCGCYMIDLCCCVVLPGVSLGVVAGARNKHFFVCKNFVCLLWTHHRRLRTRVEGETGGGRLYLMSGRGGVFEAFLHPSPGKGRADFRKPLRALLNCWCRDCRWSRGVTRAMQVAWM